MIDNIEFEDIYTLRPVQFNTTNIINQQNIHFQERHSLSQEKNYYICNKCFFLCCVVHIICILYYFIVNSKKLYFL